MGPIEQILVPSVFLYCQLTALSQSVVAYLYAAPGRPISDAVRYTVT